MGGPDTDRVRHLYIRKKTPQPNACGVFFGRKDFIYKFL